MFEDLDKAIKDKLNCKECGYAGSKPNPEDWADLIEFDSDFKKEFNRVFNDMNILEANNYTP